MVQFILKWMPFPNMDVFLDWPTGKLPHRQLIVKLQMSTNAIPLQISYYGKFVDRKMGKIFGSLPGGKAVQVGISNVVP